MLKMALAEKGIPLDGHYAIDFDRHLQQPFASMQPATTARATSPRDANQQSVSVQQIQTVSSAAPPPAAPSLPEDMQIHEDGGIDL